MKTRTVRRRRANAYLRRHAKHAEDGARRLPTSVTRQAGYWFWPWRGSDGAVIANHIGRDGPTSLLLNADKKLPGMDDAFDDSIRGSSVIVDLSWPRWRIPVREQRPCDWCGRPTVTYQPPGNHQPGGRACCTSHRSSLADARRRDRASAVAQDARPAAREPLATPARTAVVTGVEDALAQRRAQERRALDPAWRAEHCPRPDKVVWLTREGAQMQRAGMIERGGVDRPEILRVYECACGGWHVGNVAPSTLGEAATA